MLFCGPHPNTNLTFNSFKGAVLPPILSDPNCPSTKPKGSMKFKFILNYTFKRSNKVYRWCPPFLFEYVY